MGVRVHACMRTSKHMYVVDHWARRGLISGETGELGFSNYTGIVLLIMCGVGDNPKVLGISYILVLVGHCS